MATANWWGQVFTDILNGALVVDWDTNTFKVLLKSNTAYPAGTDLDAVQNRSDVTGEVSGTNYSAGGVTLTGNTVTYDSATDETRLDANDPTFTNITVSGIRKAIFYKSTGTAATDRLLFVYVFDGDQTVAAADFIIQLDVTGAAKVDTT